MKAARTVAAKTIETLELDFDTSLGSDDILIKPAQTGICGSDIHIYRGEFAGRVNFPTTQGHEFAGVIEAVGDKVNVFSPGERVAVDPIIYCGHCTACLKGQFSGCRNLRLTGVDMDGGMAELVRVKAHQCFKLPDSVSDRDGAMVELYSIGMHATTMSQIEPGDRVVVLGSGRVGLSTLENLNLSSAESVAITDISDFKLSIAEKLGSSLTINVNREDAVEKVMEWTNGEGADCVIECIGEASLGSVVGGLAPVAQAVQMIRNGGRITVLGQGPECYGVHWKTLIWKEASIRSSRVSRGEFPRVIRAVAAGKYHPELLITDTFPLDRAGEAFRLADSEHEKTIKVMVTI